MGYKTHRLFDPNTFAVDLWQGVEAAKNSCFQLRLHGILGACFIRCFASQGERDSFHRNRCSTQLVVQPRQIHKRRGRLGNASYHMSDRLPSQIEHMKVLVEQSDTTWIEQLRMDSSVPPVAVGCPVFLGVLHELIPPMGLLCPTLVRTSRMTPNVPHSKPHTRKTKLEQPTRKMHPCACPSMGRDVRRSRSRLCLHHQRPPAGPADVPATAVDGATPWPIDAI
ncbi:purple acid phosphatase 25 [Striga asiatica]|uniref:Purple acid phosphatase 25 n=1 Tax=Striga asiatica TaxID=4170 RepID=A0A5A7QWP9_STRAF|nr:purple acid phosphatase 25 [Striga asiatica]